MLDMTEGMECWISKINLIFCNLVDFVNCGFLFIEEEFLHVHVRMVIMYCRPKSNDEEDDTK